MHKTCLLLAHPGHELRLYGWMGINRPIVSLITDGSGSSGKSRLDYSCRTIESAGAIFDRSVAPMPDQAWYSAILDGDCRPFTTVAEIIAQTAAPGCLVVADPVEGYNPMHDLCSAIADRVAALVGGSRASYPLTQPAKGGAVTVLDTAAQANKRAALDDYTPLQHEIREMLRVDPDALAVEQIVTADYDWPETPDRQPGYETFGSDRTAAGVYLQTITYREHVRPMAIKLREL